MVLVGILAKRTVVSKEEEFSYVLCSMIRNEWGIVGISAVRLNPWLCTRVPAPSAKYTPFRNHISAREFSTGGRPKLSPPLTRQSVSYCKMWADWWEGCSISHARPQLPNRWVTCRLEIQPKRSWLEYILHVYTKICGRFATDKESDCITWLAFAVRCGDIWRSVIVKLFTLPRIRRFPFVFC